MKVQSVKQKTGSWRQGWVRSSRAWGEIREALKNRMFKNSKTKVAYSMDPRRLGSGRPSVVLNRYRPRRSPSNAKVDPLVFEFLVFQGLTHRPPLENDELLPFRVTCRLRPLKEAHREVPPQIPRARLPALYPTFLSLGKWREGDVPLRSFVLGLLFRGNRHPRERKRGLDRD